MTRYIRFNMLQLIEDTVEFISTELLLTEYRVSLYKQ